MDLEGHLWLMAWPWGPCITTSTVLFLELLEPDSHPEHALLLMVKHIIERLQSLI